MNSDEIVGVARQLIAIELGKMPEALTVHDLQGLMGNGPVTPGKMAFAALAGCTPDVLAIPHDELADDQVRGIIQAVLDLTGQDVDDLILLAMIGMYAGRHAEVLEFLHDRLVEVRGA